MIKHFLKDTGIYGLSGLLSKGVSILLLPFYTKFLSPADYGIMDIIAIAFTLISVSLPLEITQAVARFLADKHSSSTDQEENTVLVSSIGLILTISAFGIVSLIGILFNSKIAEWLLDDSKKNDLILVSSGYFFFHGLFYFFQNQLRWTLKSKRYAFLSFLFTVTTILTSIYFVFYVKTGLIGVFYSYFIAGFLGTALGWYYSRENYRMIFSTKKFKEMINFSLPLVPSSIGVIFINSAQRMIIKAMIGLADVGLFGLGSRFSSVINIGFQSIQGAITPLIYKYADKESTPHELARIFRYLSFAILIFFVAVSVYSKELVKFLSAPAFHSSYILIPFLLMAETMAGLQNAFTPGLFIAKKTKLIASINIFGALFALVISYLFIYYFGIVGASLAFLTQRFAMFVVQMYYSQRFYYVPYHFKKVIFSALLASVLVLFTFFIPDSLSKMNIFLAKFTTVSVFIFLAIFVLKIVEMKEITLIINRVKLRK